MNLYFQADGTHNLHEGDIINTRPYPRGNAITILGGVVDKEFREHIQRLYSEGLSFHGYNYLVSSTKGGMDYVSWAIEIYFEYIRFTRFPDKPSRFTSFFCWGNVEDTQSFARSLNQPVSIFEVSNDGKFFMTDMNLLKLDFDMNKQEKFAVKYWSGETLDSSLGGNASWEYLVDTPIKVIRRVI